VKDRYCGRGGQAARIEALRKQRMLEGAPTGLLADVAKAVRIEELKKGKVIIRQDAPNKDVFFVLCGAGLQVVINGRLHALRECGEVLGEMSMLVRNSKASATVCAAGATVVARMTQEKLIALAVKYPSLWKGMSTVLAERLQQRNVHIRPRSAVPAVFIGSSKEQLSAARTARQELVAILGKRVEVVVWNDTSAIFRPGSTTMADLVVASQRFDYGLFVFAPDDELKLREMKYEAVRDNVVLELGLYMGAFNDPRRALILQPAPSAATKALRKPTDLDGMTVLMYDPSKIGETVREQMEMFAAVIRRDGPR